MGTSEMAFWVTQRRLVVVNVSEEQEQRLIEACATKSSLRVAELLDEISPRCLEGGKVEPPEASMNVTWPSMPPYPPRPWERSGR